MWKILAVALLLGCAFLARSQSVPAPAPGAAPGQATVAPAAAGEIKPKAVERDNAQERMNTGRGVRDPGAKAPMNIRLHEGGVMMPKCAAESREGQECK